MLELTVYDSGTKVVLGFEHSLLALSKWEAKTQIAFLGSRQKTPEQMINYFQAMLVSPEQDPNLVYRLDPGQLEELTNYINASQTATTTPAPDEDKKQAKTVNTSEVMYSWLVACKIPFHPVETWHISRMTALVERVQFNNAPPKKVNRVQALTDWARINAENKKRFGSNG